jgi:hypothetical protein
LWVVPRASYHPVSLSLQSMSPRASYRGGTRGKPSGRWRACEGPRGIRLQLRPRTPKRRPFAQLATAPERPLLRIRRTLRNHGPNVCKDGPDKEKSTDTNIS